VTKQVSGLTFGLILETVMVK